nr:hypothetical protein [Tanacetum cinerariifolium]GFB22942.1 hypothetical protein [Tanacetum cinerariifolium]
MALELMAKAFQLNITTPTNNNQRSSSNPCYSRVAQSAQAEGNGNRINKNMIKCYNCQREGHYASNCRVKPRKIDVAYLQTQLQITQKEEAEIQLNSMEFDFMADVGAYDEIEKVNANRTLKDNLQQASTSRTPTNNTPVYDSDGSDE